jgi:hypothetical protein
MMTILQMTDDEEDQSDRALYPYFFLINLY